MLSALGGVFPKPLHGQWHGSGDLRNWAGDFCGTGRHQEDLHGEGRVQEEHWGDASAQV